LCPCSKAISARGAHNQRGHVTMEVRAAAGAATEPDGIWIDDLVAVAEGVASALRDAVFAHPTLAESLNNLFATLDA
jgi:GTP cyclohydrolase FolE2